MAHWGHTGSGVPFVKRARPAGLPRWHELHGEDGDEAAEEDVAEGGEGDHREGVAGERDRGGWCLGWWRGRP